MSREFIDEMVAYAAEHGAKLGWIAVPGSDDLVEPVLVQVWHDDDWESLGDDEGRVVSLRIVSYSAERRGEGIDLAIAIRYADLVAAIANPVEGEQ